MVSWIPLSVREYRIKDQNFWSCSSSEDLENEIVVCDNVILVVVTIFRTSVPCDSFESES